MTAQVLLGDPRTTQRLEHVLSAQEASRLLEIMTTPRMRLSRTWDQREEIGERLLNSGAPHEWVSLLAAYAEARGRGLAVSSSDQELVREACELIAAEISCAIGTRYAEAYEEVRTAYQQAFETHRRKAENEPRSVAIA
jgi:RNA polymerase-interacting CarD/CdnL/TRCF family regulator